MTYSLNHIHVKKRDEMSDKKKDETKAEELSDKELEQVDGGIGLMQDTIAVQIDHSHQTVNEVSVNINNEYEVDPLAVQIDHSH